MRRTPKPIPVHMVCATAYGDAHLILPSGLMMSDLEEIEQVIALQFKVLRRESLRCLMDDWEEAIRWHAALHEAA